MREIWIATASPLGRPDATPIWFWWDGSAVYFTCAAVARKARNIAAQSEVVLINERVDGAYREKYVEPHTGERATVFVADDHVYRVRLRVVAAWAYATASTRTEFGPE